MRLAIRDLLKLLTIFLRCVPGLFRSRNEQLIIELALRQQLATFAEKGRRPRIAPADRGFWVLLSRGWSGWKEVLLIVQPETVVRWHRKGFRLYWRSISKRGPGRPPIPAEVQALIRRFANENGGRARKVRAELKKLGISIGLATVSRSLPMRDPDHGQRQRWTTCLRNHRHGIAAMDFPVVPTMRFQLLYAWFVIGHGRREIIHVGVTAHPTSSWVVQQLRECVDYYNHDRVHTELQDSPMGRPTELRPTPEAKVVGIIATSGRKPPDSGDPHLGETTLAAPDE